MKENEQLLVPEQYKESCLFCRLGLHGLTQHFEQLYQKEQVVRTPTSPDNLLILDAFPLTQGHLMLMPKTHSTSAAQVENPQRFHQDLQISLQHLRGLYPDTAVILFEHGTGIADGEKVVMCGEVCAPGNDHTHVHLLPAVHPDSGSGVPLEFDQLHGEVFDLLQLSGWGAVEEGVDYSASAQLGGSRSRRFVGDSPYISFGVLQPEGGYQEVTYKQQHLDQKVPSQVLRRSLAKLLKQRHPSATDWNYHELTWNIFVDQMTGDVSRLQRNVEAYFARLQRQLR